MKETVVMEVQGYAPVSIELDRSIAPLTVENFITLVNQGFYNGLSFHRVIRGFMIQGGCPKGDGTGGSGKNIKGEFSTNGVPNSISHLPGTISMARSSEPNSASCQFFIVTGNAKHLDGSYAAFGKVSSNFETCLAIEKVKTGPRDAPQEKVVIEKMYLVK